MESQDNIEAIETIHPKLYEILKTEGFLAENQYIDKKNAVKHVTNEYASSESISITINPTLDCNLRCWYCYEKRHAGSRMSDNIIHETLSFIGTLLADNNVKVLRLSFFGGEPLLYYKKAIYPLVTEVKKICSASGTLLHLHFTTNGILITDQVLKTLKDIDCGISFQIAFDGGKSIHNSVKNLGGRSDCYSKSLRNAIEAIEAGYDVTVRCNYDQNTLNSFMQLIEDLKPYHSQPGLLFQFEKIWQQADTEELRRTKALFFEEVERRFTINSNLQEHSGHSLNRCYADYKNNFVINYDGKVFKCTARDFNSDNCIGHLSEGGLILNEGSKTQDFPYPDFCRTCRILPICPSCSQARLENKDRGCPLNINEAASVRNVKATFVDLTGIPVSI